MTAQNPNFDPPPPPEADDDWRLRRVGIVAENDDEGRRLDQVLARRYPHTARQVWQERIRTGQVRLDGQAARPGRRVRAGQAVDFVFWQKPEPGVNVDYRIQYRDEDLLVIEKPPDLPVHPSGIYRKHTLHALLKRDFGADFVVHLVHRIDRETSGLLLLAGNPTSAAALQRLFLSGAVRKEYLVIVEGRFPATMDARGWLGPDGESPVRKKRRFVAEDTRNEADGDQPADKDRLADRRAADWQTARTEFELLRTVRRTTEPAGELSLLRCRLHTGRMHQIRATLCSLGYPVVGDRLYGVDDRFYIRFINDEETAADRARLRMKRTALHSFALSLDHPRTGEPLRFEAELPEDMRALLEG